MLKLGRAAYRLGIAPQPSGNPDHRLVEVVTGQLEPGRAIDLGTGTGRNALFLAANGWDTTAVEIDDRWLRVARRHAEQRDLPVRWVHGDVTRLSDYDIGTGYHLLMDGGCYHMVPRERRGAYAASVSSIAAPGALLILVGFGRFLRPDEIERRFTAWELLAADPVPGEQMHQYVSRPAPLRAALRRGHPRAYRYQLVLRTPTGTRP